MVCPSLENYNGLVLILCGDTPLITENTLKKFIEYHNSVNSDLTVMSTLFDDPTNYGRIIRESDNTLKCIVEEKDATPEQKAVKEVNAGIYCLNWGKIKAAFSQLTSNNAQGEYYLTDIFNFIKEVEVIQSPDYEAFHGINTMQDLAKAEAFMQNQLRQKFMANGVNLVSPETVYFSHDTQIENDVVIEPNVIIGNNVKIGAGSHIYAFSHIQDCCISQNVEIGPFARIRGNSSFAEGAAIGNFVEVKGSVFGTKTKAKHLAYIGDTTIGEKTNIGAGTITCNYDGVSKSKTAIGSNVFVGSNSTLIAPITIEDNTILGAGSTFTDTVPAGSLAIARQRQINLEQKANDIWRKKGKK